MKIDRTYARDTFSSFKMSNVKWRQNRKWFKWDPPIEDWVKLNTDVCLKQVLSLAGAEGLTRGTSSQWLVGFTVNLGKANFSMAELWGLLHDPKDSLAYVFKKS